MLNFENQLKCHPAFLLSDVEESQLDQCGRISILDSHQVEQEIYIYKSEEPSEFEVRIIKHNPSDTYMPPMTIGTSLKRYVSNDKVASFFFRSFYSACLFVARLAEAHPDAQIRQVLKS